jgi:hypothetical protein
MLVFCCPMADGKVGYGLKNGGLFSAARPLTCLDVG